MPRIDIDTTRMNDDVMEIIFTLLFTFDPNIPDGAEVGVFANEIIHCQDGVLFDGFVWRGDMVVGCGISITSLSSESTDLTVDDYRATQNS